MRYFPGMIIAATENGGSFLVTPDPFLMAVSLLVLGLVVTGGVVTALKGRWGWLAVGLLLGSLIWPLTALLPAAEGSRWRKLRAASG